MDVYYRPTSSNCMFVSKVGQRNAFSSCRFVPLEEGFNKRIMQLQQINGRAAFIWGDGCSHDESYFFTKSTKVKVKANIDYHDDNYLYTGKVTCANHMRRAAMDGIETIVPSFDVPIEQHFVVPYYNLLSQIRSRAADLGKGELALSVDADLIKNFPAFLKWTNQHGLDVEEIADAVRSLGTKILRFDLGGMMEKMPEFQLTESMEKPTTTESEDVARDFAPSQSVIEKVGNYAFNAYSAILAAFVQSEN